MSRDCNPEELPWQHRHLMDAGPGLLSNFLSCKTQVSPTLSCSSCLLQYLLPLLHTRLLLPTGICSQKIRAAPCSLHMLHMCRMPWCWHHQSPGAGTGIIRPQCWYRHHQTLVLVPDVVHVGLSTSVHLLIGHCQAAVRMSAAKLLPALTFLLLSLTSSLFINCPVPKRLPPMRRCSYYAGSIFRLPSKVTSSRMSCKPD